jgi:hypothetical protein
MLLKSSCNNNLQEQITQAIEGLFNKDSDKDMEEAAHQTTGGVTKINPQLHGQGQGLCDLCCPLPAAVNSNFG